MRRVVEIGVPAVAIAVVALSAVGSVFGAYGAWLKVSAPTGVKLGATYTVSVSGSTGTGDDNELIAFEGGGKKALPCYSGWGSEAKVYPQLEVKQQYAVHGSFTKTFAFLAAHTGPKGFCAYLLNSKVQGGFLNNYASGTATWTVSS
jgi:hypothetical protein